MDSLILVCKYKIIGICNDLKKYSMNMLKFYGTSILLIIVFFLMMGKYGSEIINIASIGRSINFILPIVIILLMICYMFTSFTLIIFSKPNIFYLIRNKKLFKRIAWIKLFQQNIIFIAIILGISCFLSFHLDIVTFKAAFSSLLTIPCILNFKYYISNKKNTNKMKIITILFFSMQLIQPSLFLIAIEYLIIIKMVGNVFDDLDLESLTYIYECAYDYGRIIKGANVNNVTSVNKGLHQSFVLENTTQIKESIFFKFKRSKVFLLKDWKVIKNRPINMNIMPIILFIATISLSTLFNEYKILFFTSIYIIINIQLKDILNYNYYILFSKGALSNSIQSFVNETAYFSIIVYFILNSSFFILSYNIIFIACISIGAALVSSYNGLNNKKISIFNLLIIALIVSYDILNNYIFSSLIVLLFSFIIYKIIHNKIKRRLYM